jgi:hypothetical protein
VIVLHSRYSMASPWCFAEITHARALGKARCPVKVVSGGSFFDSLGTPGRRVAAFFSGSLSR